MAKPTAMLLALGLLAGLVIALSPPARAANQSFDLYGNMTSGWGFSSSSLTNPGPHISVHHGDVVTITLHATDGMFHEFFVDLNGNEVPDSGEPTSGSFNTTATVRFTATTTGIFDYHCYFHEMMMHGDFVVQSSTAASSPSSGTALSVDPAPLVGILAVVAAIGASAVLLLRRKT